MPSKYASLLKQLEKRRADRYRITSASDRNRQFGGLYSPAGRSVIVDAENKLGFRLPPLLREIYSELANGGFGPGYGLIGLTGGYTVEELALSEMSLVENYFYELSLGDEFFVDSSEVGVPWPEQLVEFCYLGCQGTYAVDCSHLAYPVRQTDFGKLLKPETTFDELMERWAAGND
jgi:hypothetical protein